MQIAPHMVSDQILTSEMFSRGKGKPVLILRFALISTQVSGKPRSVPQKMIDSNTAAGIPAIIGENINQPVIEIQLALMSQLKNQSALYPNVLLASQAFLAHGFQSRGARDLKNLINALH